MNLQGIEISADVSIWTAKGAHSQLSLAKITPSDSKQGSGSLFLLELRTFQVTFVHGGLTQKGLKQFVTSLTKKPQPRLNSA